jgi:hypothetical protein
MRTVPDFVGRNTNSITQADWTSAGFTGTLTQHYHTGGNKIGAQSLVSGTSQLCTASITVHDHP